MSRFDRMASRVDVCHLGALVDVCHEERLRLVHEICRGLLGVRRSRHRSAGLRLCIREGLLHLDHLCVPKHN